MRTFALIVILLLVTLSASGQADNAKISARVVNNMGITAGDTIDVELAMYSELPLGGVNFSVRYDASLLSFVSITQDTGLSNWEYFSFGHNTDSNIIEFAAIADINNGPIHPSPDDFYPNGTVVRLRYFASPGWPDSTAALFSFFWMVCGDNAVSSPAGDSLLIVNKVKSQTGALIWDEPDDIRFPEENRPPNVGFPDSCLVGTEGIFFSVDFRHGIAANYIICGDADGNLVIEITDAVHLISFIFASGPPPIPFVAGDADCNGIVEVTDAVYLLDYIFAGGPAPCANCP